MLSAPAPPKYTTPFGKLLKENEFLIKSLIKRAFPQASRQPAGPWPAMPSRGLKQQLPTNPI